MNLFISKTPCQFENKLKLLGFELIDLPLIFPYLSISNLLFGQTLLKIPLVWLGTSNFDKFVITNNEDLKKLIYGIEQHYYTTPVTNEGRLVNSVLSLSNSS